MNHNNWPEINFSEYKDTVTLVQLWTQIVGKIRLRKMPWLNHSWHVTLYVSPKGLTTGSIPFEHGVFQLEFNFRTHLLEIESSTGASDIIELSARPVAEFYEELFDKLGKMGIEAEIYAAPNEINPAIKFAEDRRVQTYDPAQMEKIRRLFVCVHKVFTEFRARYIGKSSPVHFFWGGFDLAVTRFSGKTAPKHPGGMPNMPLKVMQEAYSHEVSSAGLWLGGENFPKPCFYAYCYPTPEAFGKQPVRPEAAFYSDEMGEFFLTYESMLQSDSPEESLMEFLQSTYEAAANVGDWDRESLEFDFSEFER